MSVNKVELFRSLSVLTEIYCFLSKHQIATTLRQIKRILNDTPDINIDVLMSNILILSKIVPSAVQLREIDDDVLLNFVGDFSISKSNISLRQVQINQMIEKLEERERLNNSSVDSSDIYLFDDAKHVIPCHVANYLKNLPFYHNQICGNNVFPAVGPQFSQLRSILPPELVHALNSTVFKHSSSNSQLFYCHQAIAIDAVLVDGKNIVISTSASSGKSLVFNVPVLSEILADSSSVSLYIHPTKSLTQDQHGSLMEIVNSDEVLQSRVKCMILDGDHSDVNYRQKVKEFANVILLNPDILHVTILPNHKAWRRIFQNLKFIVLDEAHIYTGLFGSHVSAVIRRLLRICLHYGSSPRFICCSATMQLPQDHFYALIPDNYIGDDNLVVVSDEYDTSPRGEKVLLVWNPSVSNAIHQLPDLADIDDNPRKIQRREVQETKESSEEDVALEMEGRGLSAIQETILLFTELVRTGIRTICFCPVRFLVELVYARACSILRPTDPHLIPKICAYRAGYDAATRRHIERDMLNGGLIGIVSTNALELGIDIGNLDCSLHLGFPSSYCSFWQQIGRSGRSGRPSVSILVCFQDPSNQYFARNPSMLCDRRNIETSSFEKFNEHVVRSHLLYAAKELPIPQLFNDVAGVQLSDDSLLCGSHANFVRLVQTAGEELVQCSEPNSALPRWKTKGRVKQIGLRSMEDAVSLVEESSGKVIDSYIISLAIMAIYPGAIIRVFGKQYLVKSLDIHKKLAVANEVKVWYFTKPLDLVFANITSVRSCHDNIRLCQVHITITVPKFVKISPITLKTTEIVFCNVPNVEYDSVALVIDISPVIANSIGLEIVKLGVHALNHALLSIVKNFSKSDFSNLGTEHELQLTGNYRIIVFDGIPGGIGACSSAYQKRDVLLRHLFQMLDSCQCEGCPSCIHSFYCPIFNEKLSKQAAVSILKAMLDDDHSQSLQSLG